MDIEKLLENSKLEETHKILSLEILDSNFGELYLYFTPWGNNHYRTELFFKNYKGYVTTLDARTLVYDDVEKLVLDIDTISKKVTNLCEKTREEFVEEFRVDRPANNRGQDLNTEEFNLIIYNVEVESSSRYDDIWYLSVYSSKLDTELSAEDYNKEELCEILNKKHKVFLKQVTDIVLNSGG